ncbi:MAG: acyl--CoA ligase [Rhodospirillales bacterium]|nr:acyl--CoA ligase [Rhodospirillales bacterium]
MSMIASVPWGAELAALAARHGARPAARDGSGTEIDFAPLIARGAALGAVIREAGGGHGVAVASALPNALPAVIAQIGLRLAGVCEVPLNPALTDAERAHCLGLSGAKIMLCEAAAAPAYRGLGCRVLAIEELIAGHGDPADFAPVAGDAWGRILFTSGTTGAPKAIVHSHAGRWIANLLQRAHYDPMPRPGSAVALMTPFVHGAGLLAHGFHDQGAAILLLNGVDLKTLRAALAERSIDHIFAPPTVLAKIVAALDGQRIDFIRTIFTGTAPLPRALYQAARAIFGPVVRITYGKSEIVNPIAVLSPDETDAVYAAGDPGGACVGWPGSGVEIAIRDEAGAACPQGEVGEVHLRGRHMLAGHIDAAGWHPTPAEGWHATGDLGFLDAAGRLVLSGRIADVIKSGGYKIHPDEIEQALAGTAPALTVIAIPSDYWGEVIVAVGEGADAGWEARGRAALANLARHKHPRAFIAVDALARNHQGKTMRRLIREDILTRYRLIDGPYPALAPR